MGILGAEEGMKTKLYNMLKKFQSRQNSNILMRGLTSNVNPSL